MTKEVIITIPVSYTHLDVYKRQDEDCDRTIQQKGIKMAENINNITPFLQPEEPQFNKNIWYN